MSIKNNFPTIKPSLNLYFANTKQLDPRITFARASTATYWDTLGILRTAQADEPRFDHNPTTGESLGLLIEEQRTNLALYSGDMSKGSAWALERSSSTSTTIAPDGASIAACFDASGPTFALTRQGFASFSGGYTLSVYAKALPSTANRYLFIGLINGSAGFDLVGGSVTYTASGATASVSSVGNGWYRCAVAFTASSTTQQYFYFSSSPTNSLAPAAGPACALWGAQLEAGAFPTSYIPTTTAQVTRAADSARMTGANFTSWYRADEGTIYAEAYSGAKIGSIYMASITDGSLANQFGVGRYSTNLTPVSYIRSGSVDQAIINVGPTQNPGKLIKQAFAAAVNNAASSLNAGAVGEASPSVLPTVNQLGIGVVGNVFGTEWCGHIKRIAYYPKRLSNTELQALTT